MTSRHENKETNQQLPIYPRMFQVLYFIEHDNSGTIGHEITRPDVKCLIDGFFNPELKPTLLEKYKEYLQVTRENFPTIEELNEMITEAHKQGIEREGLILVFSIWGKIYH